MSDPFDILRDHVRRQATEIEPGTSTDELVAHITLEHLRYDQPPDRATRRPRRRAVVAMVVAAAVGVGAGAVVTASLDRPRPTLAGVACHPSVGSRDSVVVSFGNDPIAACAALWHTGKLPLVDGQSEPSDPPLVACTAENGGVLHVYPGGVEVCAEAGLVVANVERVLSDPLVELSRRIADEINVTCPTIDDAVDGARALLDELGFVGWNLVVLDDGGGCAVVGSPDPESRTLNVRTVPASG